MDERSLSPVRCTPQNYLPQLDFIRRDVPPQKKEYYVAERTGEWHEL